MSVYNTAIDRINDLITEGYRISGLKLTESSRGVRSWLWTENQIPFFQWIHSSLNVIEFITNRESYYYTAFPKEPQTHDMDHLRYLISIGIAILSSLKDEIESGFINRIENLISADIIETISDHTEALLEAGYKDGAAIYCRVMTEIILKKICDSKSLEYPLRATINSLSQILRNADVINLPEWRRLLSWADIGNAAAHGRFDEYTREEVQQMLQGIKTFTSHKLGET